MQIQQPYKIIVATGLNNEIGAKGDLLWRLPKDMLWFKENTLGADVIMGRKTYESFPEKYRPLPNRTNIVISRNQSLDLPKGAHLVHSLEEAFTCAEKCTTPRARPRPLRGFIAFTLLPVVEIAEVVEAIHGYWITAMHNVQYAPGAESPHASR